MVTKSMRYVRKTKAAPRRITTKEYSPIVKIMTEPNSKISNALWADGVTKVEVTVSSMNVRDVPITNTLTKVSKCFEVCDI
jgi:hypothetical protein